VNDQDLKRRAELIRALPDGVVRAAVPEDTEDQRGRRGLPPLLVTAPRNTEEVAAVVRACEQAGVPVIPRGGGTGLVLGQIAIDGPPPVLISLERMTAIRAVHTGDNVLIAEAGAILADVQQAAKDVNRLFPLSLAAEGSCRIGGNLATNAGGLNVLRYGTARDLCLGLEAVLPDGEIWHGLRRLRKDNTGYDLRNLLIGSEGTLAIITAAALRLFPRPAHTGTALFVVPSPDAAMDFLNLARDMVGDFISAFELIDATGQHLLAETMPDLRLPFPEIPDWCILVELGTPELLPTEPLFESLFKRALDAGLTDNGIIAQNGAQASQLWRMRESIPEANRLTGGIAFHDISLPVSLVSEFLTSSETALRKIADVRIGVFGHLGDGNLHYNVFPAIGRRSADYGDIGGMISRSVHDSVHRFGGSFSAEHGVGRMKAAELKLYADPTRLKALTAIKNALDPSGIMNPGAVLHDNRTGIHDSCKEQG